MLLGDIFGRLDLICSLGGRLRLRFDKRTAKNACSQRVDLLSIVSLVAAVVAMLQLRSCGGVFNLVLQKYRQAGCSADS